MNKLFWQEYGPSTVDEVDRLLAADDLPAYSRLVMLTAGIPSTNRTVYASIRRSIGKPRESPSIEFESLAGDHFRYRYTSEKGQRQWTRWRVFNDQSKYQEIKRLVALYRNHGQNTRQLLDIHKNITSVYNKKKELAVYIRNSLDGFYEKYRQELKGHLAFLERLGTVRHISQDDMAKLPTGSMLIRFCFQLTAPWFSGDERLLYPLENPVRKETVFKVPEMAAAGWKGALHNALRTVERDIDTPLQNRLFGLAREDESESERGRLVFFPSFFNDIGLYVINPHSRKRKAGEQPILLEVVPKCATGDFTLLYLPKPKNTQEGWLQQLSDDWQLLAASCKELFIHQGFGAKTGIGFGRGRIAPDSNLNHVLITTDNGVQQAGTLDDFTDLDSCLSTCIKLLQTQAGE